jgi:simple sugar transport system substrate-binding protein
MRLHQRNNITKRARARAAALCVIACSLSFGACSRQGSIPANKASVAVFVPGVVTGNPIYEELVKGVMKAVSDRGNGTVYRVIEAGPNQAEWQSKLTELAASGQFDLIVSSNPAIPPMCAEALKSAPRQKFLVTDGYLDGNPNIYTVQYNQREQGYFVGYLAGLVSLAKQKPGTSHVDVGAIVAQHYDSLDKSILPGFTEGLRAAAPTGELLTRVVGNWYDASKGAELARSLYGEGVEVILPIAGGAGQGVLSAAQELHKGVVWFDTSAYDYAPGVIIGCAIIKQEKLVSEKTLLALQGKLAFGKAEVVGTREGYVDFDDANPLYQKSVSAEVQAKMKEMLDAVRSGKLVLETGRY